jgi:hypothetical protein
VHRWRDLDRRHRAWGLAVGGALLLAPVLALAGYLGRWTPTGDAALMGLRSLDVGTARTPLLGQPSASGLYSGTRHVHHPGPLHFYLMALPVRVLGGATGMALTSVAITGASLAVSAWAVFRQLGRTAGLVAAGALALVAFTTGASSLVNPISSNIAGYPLLATGLLLWCVACGDVRLLPLATGAVSFTAQQHLSVVPACAVMTVGALALAAAAWRRDGRGRDPAHRATLRRQGAWSAGVAVVLWAPALVQQALGDEGNLGRMLWFARHGNSDTVGWSSAAGQLAHAIGLPPLLGRTEVTGQWLLSRPSPFGWASAAVVAAAVAGAGVRWRRDHPRRATLCAMAGVVALAGLVNGSSVPVGTEQYRLPFYHWTFALALLVAVVAGLAATDALRRLPAAADRPASRPLLAAVAVVAVAVPSLADPALDRHTDSLTAAQATLDRDTVDRLADAVLAHRDDLGDHPLLLTRHEPVFAGMGLGLAFALTERGVDVRHPAHSRYYVADDRLADADRVDAGIVVVVNDVTQRRAPEGGELVARADLWPGFDAAAYQSLVTVAAGADGLDLGPAGDRALADLPDDGTREFAVAALAGIVVDPEATLLHPAVLEWVRDHPLADPALDPAAADRVLASLDDVDAGALQSGVTTLHVYLLDRDEVLRVAGGHELSRPPS